MDDEEDYVFYGTPIEREEELASRKKKAAAEASGQLRTLPSWKQEVRDEEGRRRFHGAFTGGFSAGYYNTVGSKEGWAPKSFTSSRKNRAEVKQQSIHDFLDDDEKAELEGRSLATSSQFDTFGFTAAELARKQAEKEQQQRPSAIPGPVPDELVLPITESIGVKLLLKMGWRHGHSIKDSHANSLYDARREARKAFLAFSSDGKAQVPTSESEPGDDDLESFGEKPASDDIQSSRSTPVYVLNPKQDLYGLGYDPYKHAPEFQEKKISRISGDREAGNRKALTMKESLFGFKSGKAAPGFGIGALEEYDVEDEDVYASAYDFEDKYIQEAEEPLRSSNDNKPKLTWKEQGVLPGFRVASNSDFQLERFDPPVIPKDFVPQHKFLAPLEPGNSYAIPPPLEVAPPEDNNLKLLIEGVASLVARCGKLFEDLSREKNQSNSMFSFLTGGSGHDYYAWKLWEEHQKRKDQKKLSLDGKSSSSADKMTAETRGKILGERPLERRPNDLSSSAARTNVTSQVSVSDTFTQPLSVSEMLEVATPFKDDPAKQARFELFLKEKYQGGLRTTDSGGSSNMSEAARARERLDFEVAAESIEKGKWTKESKNFSLQFMEFSTGGGMQFTSGGMEQHGKDAQSEGLGVKNIYPQREEFQWRPLPILCKRFDLVDPYMGKPPPPPRIRSKTNSLVFTSDVRSSKVENISGSIRDQFPALQPESQEISKDVADSKAEVEVEMKNVERPVDLYKAIFSDDSDDEVAAPSGNKLEDPEKKVEVAHTTLNRLIAGDFLESLGKELGLEVPPDPYVMNNAMTSAAQKETATAGAGNENILQVESNSSSAPDVHGVAPVKQGGLAHQETAMGGESKKSELTHGKPWDCSSKSLDPDPSDNSAGRVCFEKIAQENRKQKSSSSHYHKRSSSSSSEDERTRKGSKRHRERSSDPSSDSSSDYRDRRHSRSKGRKKESSREKRSRRHSKHHKH